MAPERGRMLNATVTDVAWIIRASNVDGSLNRRLTLRQEVLEEGCADTSPPRSQQDGKGILDYLRVLTRWLSDMAAPGQGHLGKPLKRHDTRSALSRHPKRTHRQPLPVENDFQHAKNTYSDRGRNLNKSPGARNRTKQTMRPKSVLLLPKGGPPGTLN